MTTGTPRVGFIGLGAMGKPMCRNLLKAGFPLTVWNRSRPPVDELAGAAATAASSSAAAARQADVVITCVPSSPHVTEVIAGPDGVLEGIAAGATVIDMSTIDPNVSQEMAAACAARGVRFLDAPVSGGTVGAVNGTLTIMVGGEREQYDRVVPILDSVGKKVVYAGPVGAGAVVKLMNQLLVGINLAGAAEAMVLGVKAGVDPQLLYETIGAATGNSFQLQRCFPDLIMKGEFGAMFSVDLLHKDLALGLEVGKDNRVRLLLSALALQVFEEARELGHGEEDIAAVIRPLERLAGVEVRSRSR